MESITSRIKGARMNFDMHRRRSAVPYSREFIQNLDGSNKPYTE
jgi:hypothetical protein